ncbi:calpain-9-like [Xyrauchen texanus]|uniref:calpain-9-like n=1 Tax=Xyrauchen texanus TaxID=154827 RepID=UPI002241C2A6|nr:calpain-9-like [Xyrauchen texanus]
MCFSVGLVQPPAPNPPEEETDEEKGLRRLFEQIAGSDKAISARELQQVLNGVLSRRKEVKFDGLTLNTCHSIINLMDVDNTGMLEFEEFKVFWDKLKKWMMLFLSFDTDRSGRMSSYELRSALNAAGVFQAFDRQKTGEISLNIQQFLFLSMNV